MRKVCGSHCFRVFGVVLTQQLGTPAFGVGMLKSRKRDSGGTVLLVDIVSHELCDSILPIGDAKGGAVEELEFQKLVKKKAIANCV